MWGERGGKLTGALEPQLLFPQEHPCCLSSPGWWSSVCSRMSSEYEFIGWAGAAGADGAGLCKVTWGDREMGMRATLWQEM